MRLALAQLDSRLGDLDANRERAREVLAQTEGVADLVVFPELQLSGYSLGAAELDASCTVGELEPLAALAGRASVLLGFREQSSLLSYNSAAYFEAGSLVHVHRKLYLPHLPDVEAALFAPGGEMRAFDTVHGRMAVLICNDAWQPVLPFLAAHEGARVLLVPANSSTFVVESEEYWRDLTRLYARLLQCYVVFVNRVGVEEGFTFWGGSHVVDPYGEVVAEAPRLEEQVLVVDIDPARVDERRRELPLVRGPRFELLRSEFERLALLSAPL